MKEREKRELKYCYLWVDFAGTKEIRQLSKFIQGVVTVVTIVLVKVVGGMLDDD